MARKRRGNFLTKQPAAAGKQLSRRLYAYLGAAAGVAVLSAIGGYLFIISWLQSDSFRMRIASGLSAVTHAHEASVPENLAVDGRHMTLPEVTLKQAPLFDELSVRKLHVEVDRAALLKRILRLSHFSAEELRLDVHWDKSPASDARQESHSAAAEQAQPARLTKPSLAFIREFRPQSFESHYTDTFLTAGGKQYGLRGYHLVALPRPEKGKDAWAIAIENGRILTPLSWLRESGVQSATLLYTEDHVQLSDCKVLLTPGDIRAKGVFMPGSGLWKARVDIRKANVGRLLRDDWRKRVTGSLSGYLDMSGELSSSWEAHGELHMDDGLIEGLPILSDIRLDSTTPYRSLTLETASCHITFPYSEQSHHIHNAWLFDRIDIRAKDGMLLVRGRVVIGTDGALSGALRVAVPTKVISQLGLNQSLLAKQLFNAPAEIPGYVWLHVNLSGSTDSPQEDLSVRLATILPQCLPELADKAVESLHSVLGNFLPADMLPRPKAEPSNDSTDSARQEPEKPASSTGDKVKSVISSGLDLLF